MINPTTHAITEFNSGLNPSSALRWIKLGPDGNLWYTAPSRRSGGSAWVHLRRRSLRRL